MQSEIVVSRILWALGYHQPATYYVTGGSWPERGTVKASRRVFDCESDHESEGEWAWLDNPFSGSQAVPWPHRRQPAPEQLGLQDQQQPCVSHDRVQATGRRRRYVVQDLGAIARASRACSRFRSGSRNDIDDFEDTTLIKSVRGSEVTLNYRGLRGEILEVMSVGDIVWACELMNRLRDAQLDDAFEGRGLRAGDSRALHQEDPRQDSGRSRASIEREGVDRGAGMTSRIEAGCRAIVVAALLVWSPAAAHRSGGATPPPAQAPAPAPAPPQQVLQSDELLGDFRAGLADAAVRLPIAALLGAALALRPRRASSPRRDPAVIETQIVLAIVGALIMLVVGAEPGARVRHRRGREPDSLSREDRGPEGRGRDAVHPRRRTRVQVWACSGIAAVGTLFLVLTLWIIEGFETHVRTFLLSVKLGEGTSSKRAAVERLLQRARTAFELRTTADDELCLPGQHRRVVQDRASSRRRWPRWRRRRSPRSSGRKRRRLARSRKTRMTIESDHPTRGRSRAGRQGDQARPPDR